MLLGVSSGYGGIPRSRVLERPWHSLQHLHYGLIRGCGYETNWVSIGVGWPRNWPDERSKFVDRGMSLGLRFEIDPDFRTFFISGTVGPRGLIILSLLLLQLLNNPIPDCLEGMAHANQPLRVGVILGDGIGPEIVRATQHVLEATGIAITWEYIDIGEEATKKHGHTLPPSTVAQLKAVRHVLKAPLIVDKLQGQITCTQPDGSRNTYPSLNNAIRRELDLFVNPRIIKGFHGISGKYESLDIVIMREITEDVYFGSEHRIGNDVAAEAVKLTTRAAALKVSTYAFEYAQRRGRKHVTCLHKANVLGLTDGLFLRCFQEVSKKYPDIQADDMMIDAACYTVILKPERFDVVVTSNQYGDIFSDLVAGLAGSLGLAAGANIGDEVCTYEACHGAAPDIANQGIANPIALILSALQLLEAEGFQQQALAIYQATRDIIQRKETLTPDLGGSGSTNKLTEAIAARVKVLLFSK